MAIGIIQQPSNTPGFTGTTILQSANNDSYYVISGTNQYSPDVSEYKFIATMFANGNGSTPVATLKSFPDPTTGFGVFNTRNIVNNFVGYTFPIAEDATQIFQRALNNFATIQFAFGEEYISGTTFVQTSGVTNSNTITYINAAIEYANTIGINWTSYQMDTSQVGMFLQTRKDMSVYPFSNSETPFYAYTDLRQWLYYLNSNHAVAGLYVITRDAFLNQLNTYFIANPYNSDANEVQIVATGMQELSSVVSFTNVAYYDVALVSGSPYSSHIISQQVRYQVMQNCGRFQPTSLKLYWLDQFGEYNSWYFTQKNESTVNLTQSTYKKIQGSLNPASGQFQQQTYNPNVIPFYTAVQNSVVLTTDFLSDSDVLFLKGLFRSPAIYMENENGLMVCVTVNQPSYTINKRVNKRPYALSFNVMWSIVDFAQQL